MVPLIADGVESSNRQSEIALAVKAVFCYDRLSRVRAKVADLAGCISPTANLSIRIMGQRHELRRQVVTAVGSCLLWGLGQAASFQAVASGQEIPRRPPTPNRNPNPSAAAATPSVERLLGIDGWQSGPALTGPVPRRTADGSTPGAALPRPEPSGARPALERGGLEAEVDLPYSPQLSALLQGSSFSPTAMADRWDTGVSAPNLTQRGAPSGAGVGSDDFSSGGDFPGKATNPLRAGFAMAGGATGPMTSPPLSRTSTSSFSGSTGAASTAMTPTAMTPSRRAAPPRPVPSGTEARPLVTTNQRSQSLLHERGNLELIGHRSDDALELPPPYDVAANGPQRTVTRPDHTAGEPTEPFVSPRPDRPLAEAITSPNLPVRSGFQPGDFDLDLDLEERPDIKNQLSPEELATLAKQFSARGPASPPSTVPGPDRRPGLAGDIPSESRSLPEPPKIRVGTADELPLDGGQSPPVLFDFSAMRRPFSLTSAVAESSVAVDLMEIDYWNLRCHYERADERLRKLAPVALTPEQGWEAAWQATQVAIGLHDPQRLHAALQQMQELGSAGSTSSRVLPAIYREYATAHSFLLQPLPDYVSAAESFQTVLRDLAQRLPGTESHARQRSLLILLDSHCQMARCVAMGPYQQAPASADLWYEQAKQVTEQMIRTQQAAPLTRTRIVLQQIAGYAESGRVRDIQVLLNYLTTQEHQLRSTGQVDDSQWIQERTTAAMLQAGLMALNYRQFPLARTWGQQCLARLNSIQGKRDWRSTDQQALATASWLLGAIEFQSGRAATAQPLFLRARQLWADPLHGVHPDPLGHGERLAVTAVALWHEDQKPEAVRWGQEAVHWIQVAVDRGIASPERMETPASNLQEMLMASWSATTTEAATPVTTAVEMSEMSEMSEISEMSERFAEPVSQAQPERFPPRALQAELESPAVQATVMWEHDAAATATAPMAPARPSSPDATRSPAGTGKMPNSRPPRPNDLRR
jgi:hypothetical protein